MLRLEKFSKSNKLGGMYFQNKKWSPRLLGRKEYILRALMKNLKSCHHCSAGVLYALKIIRNFHFVTPLLPFELTSFMDDTFEKGGLVE